MKTISKINDGFALKKNKRGSFLFGFGLAGFFCTLLPINEFIHSHFLIMLGCFVALLSLGRYLVQRDSTELEQIKEKEDKHE